MLTQRDAAVTFVSALPALLMHEQVLQHRQSAAGEQSAALCHQPQQPDKVAKGILVGCELGCRSYRVQGKISKNVVTDGEVELRRSAPVVVEDESEQQAAPAVAAPTKHHQAATSLLRYLKRTAAWGLVYSSSGSSQLQGYADADYAGDPDSMRSTSGTVFVLNGAATQAAAAATKEALFLRKVLHHLGASCDPIPIFCDNQGAVALIKNPVESSRSRHIAVAHHLARERQARGEVEHPSGLGLIHVTAASQLPSAQGAEHQQLHKGASSGGN
ncbi:hypothetical protein QJQ45_004151 [Haematococcus lacustris]|nr:hypothetical protein QJQ45_004151 [Haematococcus lacustris]